jgi:hypothetical protein
MSKDAGVDEISPAEKKRIAEKQRKKIISRLDSVEKLIRSDEGHLLTESEFDSLMESIYSLKKKISTLKKKNSGDLFYQDLIIRQANILAKNGMFKAASFLCVAAAPTPAPAPAATEGKTDGGGAGLPGAIPAEGPAAGAPIVPSPAVDPTAGKVPAAQPDKENKQVTQDGTSQINNSPVPEDKGMKGFLSGMGNDLVDDNLSDDLIVFDEDAADDDLLVVEAQAADPASIESEVVPAAAPPAAPSAAPPAEITVTDTPAEPAAEKKFERDFDAALSKVTIADVITKLDEISRVFKTREIPRQLSVVDMMLDKLGLASFFPSLSEAINKSLESNNYVLTRIDGIISELTGAMKIKEIDLSPQESVVSPEVQAIRSNLEEKEEKSKARKEMRQELADKALDERSKEETPELEVTEEEVPELIAPAPAPAAPAPAAVAPPTPAPTV